MKSVVYFFLSFSCLLSMAQDDRILAKDYYQNGKFKKALLIYKKLQTKLSKKRIYEIIKDAVEIEKEFILEAIPCRMIGMNSTLMSQYIEFVADRLCVQLGYDKIYNSANPFDFMELISVETKVNFFERTNSEYALANKTVDDDVFELSCDF